MSVAPRAATSAADLGLSDRRRSRGLRAGIRDNVTPYLHLHGVLAWPLYWLGRISFEHFGLEELIAHKGTWTGLDNYRELFGNSEFWRIVVRTVVFTIVNVGLTMVISTLIGLLLVLFIPDLALWLPRALRD